MVRVSIRALCSSSGGSLTLDETFVHCLSESSFCPSLIRLNDSVMHVTEEILEKKGRLPTYAELLYILQYLHLLYLCYIALTLFPKSPHKEDL